MLSTAICLARPTAAARQRSAARAHAPVERCDGPDVGKKVISPCQLPACVLRSFPASQAPSPRARRASATNLCTGARGMLLRIASSGRCCQQSQHVDRSMPCLRARSPGRPQPSAACASGRTRASRCGFRAAGERPERAAVGSIQASYIGKRRKSRCKSRICIVYMSVRVNMNRHQLIA